MRRFVVACDGVRKQGGRVPVRIYMLVEKKGSPNFSGFLVLSPKAPVVLRALCWDARVRLLGVHLFAHLGTAKVKQ